jgi:hypothetical protein
MPAWPQHANIGRCLGPIEIGQKPFKLFPTQEPRVLPQLIANKGLKVGLVES